MFDAILSRLQRKTDAEDTRQARFSVIPPGQSTLGGESWWQSLLRRRPQEAATTARSAGTAAAPSGPAADRARADFQSSLSDMTQANVEPLRHAIRRSRDLTDLWHLRAWVYTEVARTHSQHEAERRLARLDAHFAKE